MAENGTTFNREQNKKAIKAFHVANAKLREKHNAEFGKLLVAARVELGLPEVGGGTSTQRLQDKLEKAEKRAAEARAALEARGVTV